MQCPSGSACGQPPRKRTPAFKRSHELVFLIPSPCLFFDPSPCPIPDPSPFHQGEGKRARHAGVRVIVSRARRAHVACAIPRAAYLGARWRKAGNASILATLASWVSHPHHANARDGCRRGGINAERSSYPPAKPYSVIVRVPRGESRLFSCPASLFT